MANPAAGTNCVPIFDCIETNSCFKTTIQLHLTADMNTSIQFYTHNFLTTEII